MRAGFLMTAASLMRPWQTGQASAFTPNVRASRSTVSHAVRPPRLAFEGPGWLSARRTGKARFWLIRD